MSASAAPSIQGAVQPGAGNRILDAIELPAIGLLARPVANEVHYDLARAIKALLEEKDLDAILEAEVGLEEQLVHAARALARRAYPSDRAPGRQINAAIDDSARSELHRALLALYQQHVQLPVASSLTNQFHPFALRLQRELELPWEREMMRRAHSAYDLSETALPADPRMFAEWFKRTAFSHPLYEHDLYAFIASEASRAQLEWFFTMECAGEAAFDDFVALAQVGTRGGVKMEMATNYWDEMGRGRAHAVHTHLFHRLIDGLQLVAPPAADLPWQILAGVNVMLWSCIPRRNAFRAQGTLGAVELLAPQRCTRVVHGATRVGMSRKSVVYYGAHAIIDIGHAEGWLEHVIELQVAAHPPARTGIAEGLIARADASLDYFDYCLATARTLAPRRPHSPVNISQESAEWRHAGNPVDGNTARRRASV